MPRARAFFPVLFVVAFSALLFVTRSARADTMFLHIDGLDGESNDDKKRDHIEISSFLFDRPAVPPGPNGQASPQEKDTKATIVRRVDSTSPKLAGAGGAGAHFGLVTVEIQKGGTNGAPATYIRIDLKECFITSRQWTAPSGGPPQETLTLTFNALAVTYAAAPAPGVYPTKFDANKVPKGWDAALRPRPRVSAAAVQAR